MPAVGILQARHEILEAIRQAIPILVGHGGAEDNRAPREAIIAAVPQADGRLSSSPFHRAPGELVVALISELTS